jgi:D-alanyl-D-alanine carboxypeptidase/D-alanyl-D-alanine-endopeptidase (penicillin-binding protein 4)
MRRALTAALLLLALLPAAADARSSLARRLSSAMSGAGSGSSAYVMDAASNKQLFSRRATTPRTLASNTKLFTSAAVLGRLGASSTLATQLAGTGTLRSNGTWDGNLYLRGGGDPTFGTRSFNRGYGSTANVETIAAALKRAGFTKVTGHVYGDESLFDARRGGPESGYRTSPYVGPLSALDFNHGYGSSGFLSDPAAYAAERLDTALTDAGIGVKGKPGVLPTPADAVNITEVRSPSVARLIRLENKPSDNFFAELLAKGLAVDLQPGSPRRRPSDPLPVTPTPGATTEPTAVTPFPGAATTRAGAGAVARFARTLGASPKLSDGSGMSHSDKASSRSVVRLLDGMRDRAYFKYYFNSLPIAGRDGTLDNRMRSGPARGHCHGKTGTLTGVSALSGYCVNRSGKTIVFSILMNRVGNIYSAHAIQDRMAQVIAGSR